MSTGPVINHPLVTEAHVQDPTVSLHGRIGRCDGRSPRSRETGLPFTDGGMGVGNYGGGSS